MAGEQLVSPWRACNKRCNPAGHDVPAELQGRAEESCANCSWTRNSGLAIAILLFYASEFLGSLFYSYLVFIQPKPDSERQVQAGRCWGPADRQLSYFGAHSLLISVRQHSKSSKGTATSTVNIFGGSNPSVQRKGHQAQWHSVLLDLQVWMWYKGTSGPWREM